MPAMPSRHGALLAALLPAAAAASGPDLSMGLHASKEFVRFSAGDPKQAPTLILSATGLEDLSQMAQAKLRELEQYAQDALLAKVLHARQQVNQTRNSLHTVADEVAARLHTQAAALERQWEQLAVASSHGQVGKCCCPADGPCGWEAFRAGADKECPVGLQDYRDRVKPGAKGTVTSDAIDTLLAQCVASAGWSSLPGAPAGQPAAASSTTTEEVRQPLVPSTTAEVVQLPSITGANTDTLAPTALPEDPMESVAVDPMVPEEAEAPPVTPAPTASPGDPMESAVVGPLTPEAMPPPDPPAPTALPDLPMESAVVDPLLPEDPSLDALGGGAAPVTAEPVEVAPAPDATSSTPLLAPGVPVDEMTRSPTTFSSALPAEEEEEAEEEAPPTISIAEQVEQEPETSTTAQQLTVSISAPAADSTTDCSDEPTFFDESGEPCRSWAGRDCRQAVEEHGFSQDGEDDVIDSCPRSCGLCAQTEPQPANGSEFEEPCDCDGEDLVHVTISAVLTPMGTARSAGSLAQRRQSGCTCRGRRHDAALKTHANGRSGGKA